eukprot:515222_1
MAIHFEHIDKNTQYIVFGYIRSHQTLFEHTPHPLFQIVPVWISKMCTLFYHTSDHFETIGNNTKSSEDNKTLTKLNTNWDNTSYGSMVIESDLSSVCRWHLNIKSFRKTIIFGVSSKPYQNDVSFDDIEDASADHKYYAFWNVSKQCHHHARYGFMKWRRYGFMNGLTENDRVCIELDLRLKRIKLYRNDIDQGVAFHNVEIGRNIHYKLAVSMLDKSDCISILKFEQM